MVKGLELGTDALIFGGFVLHPRERRLQWNGQAIRLGDALPVLDLIIPAGGVVWLCALAAPAAATNATAPSISALMAVVFIAQLLIGSVYQPTNEPALTASRATDETNRSPKRWRSYIGFAMRAKPLSS